MSALARSIRTGLSPLPAFVTIALIAAACGPAPAGSSSPAPSTAGSAAAGWEQEWEALIAAAQEEGTVVFAGQGDADMRERLSAAFTDRFGIDVEYLVGTNDLAARILSEHDAGVYTVDVVNDGMGTMSTVYAQEGAIEDGNMGLLAPMADELILPEVLDTSKYQGNKLWFVDPESAYIWRMVNLKPQALTLNADVVDPADITSWHDLLKPEYKGKIVANDPAGFGAALTGASLMLRDLGDEYFQDLYLGQEVFISDDPRLLADQLARGGYGIALYLDEEDIAKLVEDGFNIAQPPDPPEIQPIVGSGASTLGLVATAPHPNAARLFVNWLLSQEGQQLWQDEGLEVSVRTDLETRSDYPEWWELRVPDPNTEYFDGNSWDFTAAVRDEVRAKVAELLGTDGG